jgi:prophage maintenance system killer protein
VRRSGRRGRPGRCLPGCLVDGNKRLAFSAGFAFCVVNTGRLPEMPDDDAYDVVIAIREHRIDVPEVAQLLRRAGVPDHSLE